ALALQFGTVLPLLVLNASIKVQQRNPHRLMVLQCRDRRHFNSAAVWVFPLRRTGLSVLRCTALGPASPHTGCSAPPKGVVQPRIIPGGHFYCVQSEDISIAF